MIEELKQDMDILLLNDPRVSSILKPDSKQFHYKLTSKFYRLRGIEKPITDRQWKVLDL